MKAKPVVLHVVLAAVVIGALLAGLAVQAAWPERRWMNIQLHSAMEALGGLAAIVMAFVLLQRRQEPGGDTFSRLALGFLGMGLLEEFHTSLRWATVRFCSGASPALSAALDSRWSGCRNPGGTGGPGCPGPSRQDVSHSVSGLSPFPIGCRR